MICCPQCHNPESWDVGGGLEAAVDEIIADMLKNPLIDGLTLSGGEPFIQAADCASIAAAAREAGLNVWVFTGFAFEDLHEKSKLDKAVGSLLNLSDVIVDGKYIASKRTLSKKWCGSANQRVIDVKESLRVGEIILLS